MRSARIGWRGVERAGGGFTLIEILSAMALAVLIMIGLAQVFKISSQAVSETEATTDAYQQARAALTMLQRDFGQSAPIYVWLIPGQIRNDVMFRGSNRTVNYRWDTLYLTTVGQEYEMGDDPPRQGGPLVSGGAEVVYTYGMRSRAGPPLSPFEYYSKTEATSFYQGDPRTTMMVRKAFLLNGQNPPQKNTTALILKSQVAAPPTENSAPPMGNLTLMMIDRWAPGTSTFPPYRVAAYDANFANQPLIHVEPAVNGQGFPSYKADVGWVVADRVSEFFVEAYVWDPNATPPGYTWKRETPAPSGSSDAVVRASRQMLWCGNAPRPTCLNGASGNGPWGYAAQANMPGLFRVTMVVHPHNDTARIDQLPYASSLTTTEPKYRGMVFREVFSVNGVLTYPNEPAVVGGNVGG